MQHGLPVMTATLLPIAATEVAFAGPALLIEVDTCAAGVKPQKAVHCVWWLVLRRLCSAQEMLVDLRKVLRRDLMLSLANSR